MFENSATSTFFNSFDFKCLTNLDKPALGDVWNVYVSKIDSLKYFYIQKTDHFEYIKTISSALELMKDDLMKSKKSPKIGNLIAVHDDESDLWYRAKIKKKNESGLFVCFIDFGDAEVLVKDFKKLPIELTNIKPIAHHCLFNNLSKIDEKVVTDDLFYLINNYLINNEMTVNFLSNVQPYSVILSHNGKDFLDIISGLILEGIVPGIFDDRIERAKYKMLNKMSTHNLIGVSVVEPIISIKHFYVETEFSNEIGKKVRNKIENQKNWIPVLHPDPGKIVITRSTQDKKLYRARVILYYEGCIEYKCFLIDCGTFEICSEFFEASDYLRTTPPVKISCCLNESDNVVDNLLESITISFLDEMNECKNSIKMLNVIKVGSPCTVDLEVDNLKMSKILKPREVKVIDIYHINLFIVLLNVNGMRTIVEVLKNKRKFCTVSNPKMHELYVAKVNQQYKRVKYVGRQNSDFKVMLVDELPLEFMTDELYELPKSIQNIKTMELCCSLGLNSNNYSKKKFIDICKNGKTTFLMVVIKNDHTNGHIVKLFLNSTDITTMIVN